MLEAISIGKQFAARDGQADAPWVVRDLNFHIAEGELVTIVGPSGAGKSTILSMLAQVEPPTEGRFTLRGQVVLDAAHPVLRPGLDCQIGYVTQDDNLLPWRNLRDNILFPLEIQGRLDDAGRQKAQELMKTVGLEGYESYYPHQLSGGMRKRAALIRTLVYDPPIILMDEPFGALDAETRALLQADLQRLCAVKRKTILFVTHEIAEAVALGDRVLVLDRAPAHVAADHVVNLPRPRVIDELLVNPAFVTLYDAIRRQIR
jgi:NitT/TauT family transport system ATP-binding protein